MIPKNKFEESATSTTPDYKFNKDDVISSICEHPPRLREYYGGGCFKCYGCHKIIVDKTN